MMTRLTIILAAALSFSEVCWLAAADTADSRSASQSAVQIGDRIELFLDDWLIDASRDVRHVLHSPRPAEIAIRKDKPWEDSTMYDPVVMKDGSRYRMWYRANFNQAPFYTAYAESDDGIRWTKPSLGLIEFRGSRENNIVWVGDPDVPDKPYVLSVFKDGHPKTPASERYKATGLARGGGLQGLVSPDGLRWRLLQTTPVVPAQGAFDSHNISLWDSARQEYVVYTRGFENGIRRIRRTTSREFSAFPAPEFITVLNPPDAPIEHLYKNAATPYYRRPDILLMFPKRFVPERKPSDWPHNGLSDIVFMFSRDGIRWDRRFREAFLRPGLDPLNWHERAIEAGPGLAPTGRDEMSLYYVEHYRTDTVRIRRGALRIDGLVSIRAGYGGGELTTRPLVFEGNQLVINFSTSAVGCVQVELQDAAGDPLPGFRLADCPEVFGDRIEHAVTWKESGDVGRFAGTPIRLRFVLSDADLFSIRFRLQP